eukprot:TRINITY_DN2423_c0_g1_i2.p1 TRINITY_DN2423_c0_g1~~TRINITY_DN2423_c0_g1_i2.p1  ORF type:complete len:137 (+),score=39.08 TRINITY_DN2423_c0_g1_i2:161-571(+)
MCIRDRYQRRVRGLQGNVMRERSGEFARLTARLDQEREIECLVCQLEEGYTKQMTDTPEQEHAARMLSGARQLKSEIRHAISKLDLEQSAEAIEDWEVRLAAMDTSLKDQEVQKERAAEAEAGRAEEGSGWLCCSC